MLGKSEVTSAFDAEMVGETVVFWLAVNTIEETVSLLIEAETVGTDEIVDNVIESEASDGVFATYAVVTGEIVVLCLAIESSDEMIFTAIEAVLATRLRMSAVAVESFESEKMLAESVGSTAVVSMSEIDVVLLTRDEVKEAEATLVLSGDNTALTLATLLSLSRDVVMILLIPRSAASVLDKTGSVVIAALVDCVLVELLSESVIEADVSRIATPRVLELETGRTVARISEVFIADVAETDMPVKLVAVTLDTSSKLVDEFVRPVNNEVTLLKAALKLEVANEPTLAVGSELVSSVIESDIRLVIADVVAERLMFIARGSSVNEVAEDPTVLRMATA